LNLSQGTQLIDGAENVLKTLNGNVGMILMTNGIKEVQRSRLSLSTISKFSSDIIISDEVGVAKPNKEIFEIAFKKMLFPDKEKVLMIGDNLSSDIKGGMDFGIPTCWYNPRKRDPDPLIRADYEIYDLQDIPSLVGIE
jgi:putative hydrolase of the HAD superfamily